MRRCALAKKSDLTTREKLLRGVVAVSAFPNFFSKILSHLRVSRQYKTGTRFFESVRCFKVPSRLRYVMPDHSRKLFEALVRQNEASLIACLRTMVRDPGLADDLFQETLLTAWKRFDQYDQSLPLAPWLRGIAINLARNAARRKQRECLVFDDSVYQEVEATMQSFETIAEDGWAEKSSALADCLTRLPARSRELIRHRYEENLNASVIAEVTRTSSAAVRKQLQRVRAILAQCVAEKAVGAKP